MMALIKELFCNPETGAVSHTKFWTNIAYAVATAVVVVQAYRATLTADMILIYLAVVGAHGAASKWIAVRYNSGGAQPAEPESKP